MDKAIKIIFALLTALFVGVTFIPPDDKAFSDNKYFQPVILETDYREKVLKRNGVDSSINALNCNFASMGLTKFPGSVKYASTELKHIKEVIDASYYSELRPSMTYFVGIGGLKNSKMSAADAKKWIKGDLASSTESSIITLSRTGNSFYQESVLDIIPKSEDTVYFMIPYGTPIIAPQDAYITNGTKPSLGAYDAVRVTDGTFIQVIVEKNGYLYQLTFGGLERWWCCLEKDDTTPELHTTYKHSTLPGGSFKVPQYSVLGKAGLSGTPENVDINDITTARKDLWGKKAILSVTVKKSASQPDLETILKVRTGQGSYNQWIKSSLFEYYSK